jgi:hypothetical protein
MSKRKFRNDCIKIYVNDSVGTVAVEWFTPTSYEVREALTKGFYGQNENELIRWIGLWNWKIKQN